MKLEAMDLSFGYHGRSVGRETNIVVRSGEVMCLLGPNGCGKTTLFKTLLGLLAMQGGDVRIDQRSINRMKRPELARLIAYVPQASAVSFPYTALDLVLMGRVAHRGIFSGPTAEDARIALDALDQLGIADLAHRDVTQLSGGQRQLVVVARAVAQVAPLIVMDEPTASLDFGNQVAVLRHVRRLAAGGTGIVLSTHNPDHAFAIADRVALMRRGQLLVDGKPAAVLTSERLASVYDVDVRIATLDSGQTVCAPDYGASAGLRGGHAAGIR